MSEAYRITTGVKGGKYAVKSVRHLRKRVPPGRKAIDNNVLGLWVIVATKKDDNLYMRCLPNTPAGEIEVQTGDPQAPMKRFPDKRPGRLAQFLVPILDGAHVFRLVERKKARNSRITSNVLLEITFSELAKQAATPPRLSDNGGDR